MSTTKEMVAKNSTSGNRPIRHGGSIKTNNTNVERKL